MSILKKAAAVIAAGAVLMTSGCFGFGGGELTPNPVRQYDYSTMHLIQLEEPYDGQPMAVIETTYGTIKAVLYPEQAPNTVANFVNCANDGYYDGKDVYCIVDGAFFMTGSVDEVRNSGITSDGQPIANEYSVDLWPFKGAICSFAGQGFIVVNQRELTESDIEQLRGFTNDNGEKLLPDELVDAFVEKGVIADFSGEYTVFAQTIEGMDVIEKICSAEVTGGLYDPVEPIYINKITISEYHAE